MARIRRECARHCTVLLRRARSKESVPALVTPLLQPLMEHNSSRIPQQPRRNCSTRGLSAETHLGRPRRPIPAPQVPSLAEVRLGAEINCGASLPILLRYPRRGLLQLSGDRNPWPGTGGAEVHTRYNSGQCMGCGASVMAPTKAIGAQLPDH